MSETIDSTSTENSSPRRGATPIPGVTRFVEALRQRQRWLGPVTAALAGIAVIAMPWLGLGVDWQRQFMLVAFLALVVSGLNLSFGFAGELALGQAVMYATGAYVTAYLALNVTSNIVVTMLCSIIAAMIVGLAAGVAGLRLGGWTLGLVSFLLIGLVPRVVNIFSDALGGFQGLSAIPMATLGPIEFTGSSYYVLVAVCAVAWIAVFRNIVHSREGRSYLVLKQSPMLAQSLGLKVRTLKLRVYALGAIPAGIAGCLYAFMDGYVNPSTFAFNLALVILAASILGGSQSVYGAVLGAFLLQLAPRELTIFEHYSEIAYGVLLVAGGALLPAGFAGIGRWLLAQHSRRAHQLADTRPHAGKAERPKDSGTEPAREPEALSAALGGAPIVIDDVVMRFGGFTALDRVSFTAAPGQVTALIGPNGSGKTTLLNVITGLLDPTDGSVSVGDTRVSGQGTRSARSGVSRTFQTPLIPTSSTVLEVAESGRFVSSPTTLVETVLRLPRYLRRRRNDRALALQALGRVGLADRTDIQASTLSLGPRRLLEVARALTAAPSVLLLDEVASGLDEAELAELERVIRDVRDAGTTILLVEHNFEFVRSLADHVVVLAEGSLLAEGNADEIAADHRVIQHYLGSEAAETALIGEEE